VAIAFLAIFSPPHPCAVHTSLDRDGAETQGPMSLAVHAP
jgi:hypothetical protein